MSHHGAVADQTALVLARAQAPLQHLVNVLAEQGLAMVTVADLDPEPNLVDSIMRAVRVSDIVIVVWDTPRLPRAVMFEAGVAVGLGAPMVLLDARQASTSRDDLAVESLLTIPRLNAPLGYFHELREGMRIAIDVATNYRGQLVEPKRLPSSRKPLAPEPGSLEERILFALDRLEPTSITARRQAMEVPDWRVWIDRLGPAFNPVFVEASARRPVLKRKEEQLFSALAGANGHLALLVLAEDHPSRVLTRRDMAICQVSLETLEGAPLEVIDLLGVARNRLLHGPA